MITTLSTPATAQMEKKYKGKYFVVFEVDGNTLNDKFISTDNTKMLGVAGWNRITQLIPLKYRENIVQFNVMSGRRWAGNFSGDGENDVNREGYRLSIAKYLLQEEGQLMDAQRPASNRRGTLDWTLIHELGHYICLERNAIELFSQSFDGDMFFQPERRKKPNDYPKNGSPITDGHFVTSYAERTPGDEEVVETFTTYMTLKELPSNDSLVARKIRFFNTLPGFPELRAHIQRLNH